MRSAQGSIAITLVSLCGCVPAAAPPSLPVIQPPVAEAADSPTVAAAAARVPRAIGPCRQVRDGNAIARLQGAADELMTLLKNDPSFAGARFEHHPCYRLVLSFTEERARPQVVEAAAAELRPYLSFDWSPMSRSEFERAREEVFAAVAATRVRALIAVSPIPPKLEIGVRTEEEAQLVRSVIPVRYRAITRVVPGGYTEPIPE